MKNKFQYGDIITGKKVRIDTLQGTEDCAVIETNSIYFIAANAKRKFQVSFETGKVKDITEYKYDREGLINGG